MKRIIFHIVFLIIIGFTTGYSGDSSLVRSKSWYIPDYAKLQFAGNIGFLSVGAGYKIFGNLLQADILYGYVPSSVGGTTIHTIAQKNTFLIYDYAKDNYILSPIAGFSINVEVGGNSYLILPEKYPDGYYNTNAIHLTFFMGGNIFYKFKESSTIKGLDFYGEVGTVDIYLWYKITNEAVKLSDIFSLAFGVNVHF